MIKYFKHDVLFSSFVLIAWGFYGYYLWGTLWSALSTMFIIVILGLLEISLSFDNAIVNVKFLKRLNKERQHKFLTRWILIAVFGMRFIFPIVLVSIFVHISPWNALHLAFTDPQHYSEILEASHTIIAGFGGAFLMMVGLSFFFEQEKKIFWMKWIEKPLEHLWKIQGINIIIVLTVLQLFSYLITSDQSYGFFIAGIRWVVLYLVINGIGSLFGHDQGPNATKVAAQSGLIGFLYLEILDASFSLDGVIGAFALSSNIFVIAAWLGIGAFFIRSLTFYMLEKKTLKTYRYLEHGAFYSVLTLSLLMITSSIITLPDVVVWCIGLLFVSLSFYASRLEKKYNKPRYKKIL